MHGLAMVILLDISQELCYMEWAGPLPSLPPGKDISRPSPEFEQFIDNKVRPMSLGNYVSLERCCPSFFADYNY